MKPYIILRRNMDKIVMGILKYLESSQLRNDLSCKCFPWEENTQMNYIMYLYLIACYLKEEVLIQPQQLTQSSQSVSSRKVLSGHCKKKKSPKNARLVSQNGLLHKRSPSLEDSKPISKQFIGKVVENNPVIIEITKLIITFSFKTEKLWLNE